MRMPADTSASMRAIRWKPVHILMQRGLLRLGVLQSQLAFTSSAICCFTSGVSAGGPPAADCAPSTSPAPDAAHRLPAILRDECSPSAVRALGRPGTAESSRRSKPYQGLPPHPHPRRWEAAQGLLRPSVKGRMVVIARSIEHSGLSPVSIAAVIAVVFMAIGSSKTAAQSHGRDSCIRAARIRDGPVRQPCGCRHVVPPSPCGLPFSP